MQQLGGAVGLDHVVVLAARDHRSAHPSAASDNLLADAGRDRLNSELGDQRQTDLKLIDDITRTCHLLDQRA